MNEYEAYIAKLKSQLKKALNHLEYSYRKIQSFPYNPDELNEETLETWESFCARFSRVVDLFLMRYVKAVVKSNDPGFEGTLRDFVNQAEKLGLVTNANDWMKLRELRNISAHEYTDKDLAQFLKMLKEECPKLLELKNAIN